VYLPPAIEDPMSEQAPSGNEWQQLRTDIPHPARVYDYWLGGKDNFEVDRAGAEEALRYMPEFLDYALGNRRFLVRAIRFLSEAGITQFLDIGSGFPTSPNVHEVARAANPDSRVVYVDNDPMVFNHARALLADSPGTDAVFADLRDPDALLSGAAATLDLAQPVALLFVATLHHIEDGDDPAANVARYLDRLAPGSYLVISHCTDDFAPDKVRERAASAREWGLIFVPRSHADILAMFNGRPLAEPGLTLVTRWRPDEDPGPNADRAWAYGGVASL
jgi:SAM-dependent methyltransferase